MAAAFTDDYRVYLINLRGAGQSVKAVTIEEYSMEETLKDLEALRKALKHEKWAFAGHSTGGMLALKYAINHPASLTKIIAGVLLQAKNMEKMKTAFIAGKIHITTEELERLDKVTVWMGSESEEKEVAERIMLED